MILELSPLTYIQTAFRDGGYMLEMREDEDQRHFRAIRRSGVTAAAGDSNFIFKFEEVREAFMSYASEAPMPHFLMWERMHFAE